MGLVWSKDERAEVSAPDARKNEFHKLLQECQNLTKGLVRDVIGLLRSLDLLLPTTQILKDNLTINVDKTDHGSTEETSHLEIYKGAALKLLLATEEIQLCQKQSTMNTLGSLLRFIKRLVQVDECEPGSFGEELLEAYMKGIETTKTIEEGHVDAPETQNSGNKNKKKKDKQKDISHLEKAYSELKQKIAHLEQKDASFYAEKKILNESIKKLESQLKFIYAENKFKEMSDDLAYTSKLTEAEKEPQDIETRTTALNEECERLKDEKRILETERNEEVQRNKELETELTQKSDEHKILIEQKDEKLNELIKREIELNETIKEREEDNAKLNKTLQNANDNFGKVMGNSEREKEAIRIERINEKRRNEEVQTNFTEKIEKLRKELQDIETRTTALNEDCERLKDEKRILETERNEEVQRNKELETELTQKSDEHKVLIEQKDEQLNELIKREIELNETIKDREEENAKLHKTLQNANDNFGKVMGNSEREKESIMIERDNEKRRNVEVQTKFTEKIENLRKELQDIETRTTALNEECERLKDEKRILETERNEEVQRNKELETELTQKSDEHKLLIEQKDVKLKELTRRETELNETIQEREEEIAKLNKTLQNANDNFGKVMGNSEREKESIIIERDNEKRRNKEVQTKFTEKIEKLRKEFQDTETRTTALNEECERLKDVKRILETERNEEVQRNKELETELTQKSDEHKILIEQKDVKLKELTRRETELNETIQEREEEIAKLNKTLQNANDNFGKVMGNSEREKESIIIERDNEKRRNKEVQTKFTEKIEKLRKEFQDTETRTSALNEECERLKDVKRILEAERNEEVQRNKELETELTQKSDEHKILIEQKDVKLKELTRRETELNETIQKREEEIAKLNKTLQNANDNFGKVMGNSEREKEAIRIERDNEKRRNEEVQTKFTEKLDNLRKELQDTDNRTTALNEECERLKDEKRILETERSEEVQRNKELETELTQKSDEHKILIEQKDEKLNELIRREIELNETIKEREEENAKLNKTLQEKEDNFDKLMKKFDCEKKFLIDERDEEQMRRKKLETELTYKIDDFKQQLKQKEKKIGDFILEHNKMESKEIEYQSRLHEKEQKINELIKLNKTMRKQELQNKQDYENKKMSLENEIQRLQRQIDMLRGDLKEKSDSENKLLEETKVLTADILKMNEHIKRMSDQHKNTKLQLTNKISAMTQAQLKEKNEMEDREHTLASELQNVRSANKTLNDKICKEQHIRKENENFITGLKEQMTHIEKENAKLSTRLTKIAQDLENCTAENETIKNELEKIKSRKVIQIQMYSQSGVGLLSSVEDELKCVLKSKMDLEEGVDVDIINCAKASDIQPNIPLLILCIQASRLGTAVASTVHGLTLTPKMAVLIFHHKDVHALPNQASERVLTGQELRNLGGIFDLAFLSGKGIYHCEMNRTNFISLVNFINREGTKRIRNDI